VVFKEPDDEEIQGGVVSSVIHGDTRYMVDMVMPNESGLSWLPVWVMPDGSVRRHKPKKSEDSTRLEKIVDGDWIRLVGNLTETWRPDEATRKRLEDQRIID